MIRGEGNVTAVPVAKLGYAGGGFVLTGVSADQFKKLPSFKNLAQ